ncbi:hypothetical protein DFH27DRAFT_617113 [Peziza echinospora]|nr:hypothetical protein DFH27DRAFT_617113 [Peziza echinospora]
MPPKIAEITGFKNQLGFGEITTGRYKGWRTAVKAQAQANPAAAGGEVSSPAHTGFEAPITVAVAHGNFPVSGRTNFVRKNTQYHDGRSKQIAHNKAVRGLVYDCIKKTKGTAKARRIEDGEEEDNDETGEVVPLPKRCRTAAGANAPVADNWLVEFYIRAPNGFLHPGERAISPAVPLAVLPPAPTIRTPDHVYALLWHDRSIRELGTVVSATVEGIFDSLGEVIPEGRTIRSMTGALANSPPPTIADGAPIPYHLPTNFEVIKTDNSVQAWLEGTRGVPIKMLLDFETCEDEASDSEPYRLKKPKGAIRKVMPRTDKVFQRRVVKLRRRIRRIQAVHDHISSQYKADFPENEEAGTEPIHDNNEVLFDILEAMDLPENNPAMWIHCRVGVRREAVIAAYDGCDSHQQGVEAAVIVANAWKTANPLP